MIEQQHQDPEFNEVYEALYKELRRLAHGFRRRERYVTLSATELVGAAWIKLQRSSSRLTHNPLHVKRIAARAMRQILVDAVRRRYGRRKQDQDVDVEDSFLKYITLDPDLLHSGEIDATLLDVHRALDQLASENPRLAEVVEMRYFAGMTYDEIEQVVGRATATIDRDRKEAEAFLKAILTPVRPKSEEQHESSSSIGPGA